MRESIGTTWVLQLVILFILLFVGFLTLSLNYSKSYKVKNELLSVVEKYEGLTTDSVKIINNYLTENGYKTMGKCGNDGWYGTKNIDSSNGVLERTTENDKYYYCVRKKYSKQDYYYYEIKTFLSFNLPIVGKFAVFTIEGSTADVISADSYTSYN